MTDQSAVEALPSGVCDLTGARHHDLVTRKDVDALIETLDAARPAAPVALDVERLARAVRSMRYGCDKSADGKHGGVCGHPFFNTDNGYAEALAREYAALRSKEPTDDR